MSTELANPVRVLIADDHPIVRLGLVTFINAQPGLTVAAEVASGAEGEHLRRNGTHRRFSA